MATGRQYDKIINGDVVISQPTTDNFSITFNLSIGFTAKNEESKSNSTY